MKLQNFLNSHLLVFMVSGADDSGATFCEEVPVRGIGSGWLLVDGIGNVIESDVWLCEGLALFSLV